MKQAKHIVIRIFLVAFLVLPLVTKAETTYLTENVYRAQLLELIASLQQQIVFLQQQLQARKENASQVIAGQSTEGPLSQSVDMIVRYNIDTSGVVSDIANKKHRDYFERVFALYPDQYDGYVSRVAVYDADSSEFDAFVETIPPQHERWLYAVNESMLKDVTSTWNTELIIHELAHIVSYETEGEEPLLAERTCDAYFKRHGCPVVGSYLDSFVEAFWEGDDLDRAEEFAAADDEYESAYAYYEDHETEYVSDYAAVAPEEDFAESFMYFMLEKKPVGKTAKQKVAFFGTFNDLVEMREEIREAK
jgi:hypothetical protein